MASTLTSTSMAAESIQHEDAQRQYPKPMRHSGFLKKFKHEDVTPVIGREFPHLNVVDDILYSSNADGLIRDLAINIAERGVVFFRAQDNLTLELQKQLIYRLGELSGKPASSGLHINPVQGVNAGFGSADPEVTPISSVNRKGLSHARKRRYDAALWHADGQFERLPPSYTSLRLWNIPKTGGDTLWASGYEIYDRFSKPYQKFLEGLTATFVGDGFINAARDNPDKIKLYDAPRGSPDNIGSDLTVVHPVVRTHPVSGWKCIFPVGPPPKDMPLPKRINEIHEDESAELLKRFYDMILQNHDMTVRFKWQNENDFAIWDNRCVFHSATFDYEGQGDRVGVRISGVGEVPYFDPSSMSRTQALSEAGNMYVFPE